MKRRGRLLVTGGLLGAALLSGGTVEAGALGPEFRVNTSTSGEQIGPAVVTAPDGTSIVVWEGAGSQSGQSDGVGVFGQRYAASGTKLGTEFRVNTTTSGDQAGGDLDVDSAGRFVVVWEGAGPGDSLGVFGQRYDASGNKVGGEFIVNTYTAGEQAGPGVAMAPGGSFVVAWESDAQDGAGFGVYAQRFNADGTRNGTEFRVNNTTSGDQAGPSLLADDAGNIVIVYESFGQVPDANGYGVFARRFNASGPAGNEFLLNTAVVGDQAGGDVDVDSEGNMIVVWESFGQDASGTMGTYGQRLDAAGSKLGSEFRINTVTSGDQMGPDVDVAADDSFVVTWDSYGQDGSGAGVYAQRYLADGTKNGSEFRVSTSTSGDQLGPSIDTDASGNLLIVWEGNGTQSGQSDGSGSFGQRFDFAAPDTTITSGPTGTSQPTSATFTFTSTEAGSTFACQLDGSAFAACTSPKSYTSLAPGGHTFSVRATDAAGNVDPTPAVQTWGVLDQSKPLISLQSPGAGRIYVADSAIVGGTGGTTIVVGSLTLKAQASDPQSGIESFFFEVDGVAFGPSDETVDLSGVHTYTLQWHWGLVPGQHTVKAFAYNGAGLLAGVAQTVVAVGTQ